MKTSILFSLIALFFCSSCNHSEKADTDSVPRYKNILILGNSIVAHDPAPEIGWEYDWGMAASARDSDFVHILEKEIHGIDKSIKVSWGNLSVYENNYETYNLEMLSDYKNMKPDMIILKISENVKYTEGMDDKFIKSYGDLLDYLAPSDSVKRIIVEGFWPTPVNGMIKEYAMAKDYTFVPLADLFENDKTNAAIGLFEHEGVSNHPSDKGMRNIARRIWENISGELIH